MLTKVTTSNLENRFSKKRFIPFFVITVMLFLSSCSLQAREGLEIDGKIVFYSNRHNGKWGLYLYDGRQAKFLVKRWAYAEWFSDGQQILAADGGPQIAILDLEGKVLRTVETGLPTLELDLLFDGSGFVFKSTHRERDSEGKVLSEIDNMYLCNLEDGAVTNVTLYKKQGLIRSFDVSPVNSWVAVSWFKKVPREALDPKTYAIVKPALLEDSSYLLNLQTKERLELDKNVFNLRWTPDGKQLYYESSNKDGQKIDRWSGLFAYDLETKTSTLIHEPFGSTGFRFSPDGKKILYSNWCANGICLYVTDLETKESKPLLNPIKGRTINDQYPDWHE